MTGQITRPEEFFGFQLGSDRKMARWDEIVQYFELLDAESDCIEVRNMGETTEGNPFLLTIISSSENLRQLEKLRQINLDISDPRGIDEEEVQNLISEGKAVVCQTMSMHATEIGGTQMAPKLAYELLGAKDGETQRILDNVIFLMVPCFNPDGQIMVADWYQETLGGEYEGTRLPWLYHKYAGHDNNRDAFMLNLRESQYVGSILFTDWKPQAYQDHHHMGSYGARFYVAPYCNPIHPHADPLIWREHAWFGSHMAYKLEEAGCQGVLNAAQFPGWGHLGFHWITAYHNVAGMLTESASANLASPLYIHPDQLDAPGAPTMPEYEAQTNFPSPWEGGWWHLRDIVKQKKVAARALLDICARYKDTVLHNAYLKAKRQISRGKQEEPGAFIIEPRQHDPLTADELVRLLLAQGIEVRRAEEEFEVDGRVYPAGTHAVFLQQPKRGLIRTLLERTEYPDNYWTRTRDGSPRVFDTATDTVAEFMGVQVSTTCSTPVGEFTAIDTLKTSAAVVRSGQQGYILDPRLNLAHAAASRLCEQGTAVWRLDEPVQMGDDSLPAGAFYIPADGADEQLLQEVACDLGVDFWPAAECPECARRTSRLRLGIYQRYWGGNADEGWTRFILDNMDFPYQTITDDRIRRGALKEDFDVIILPHDRKAMIVDITAVDDDSRLGKYLKWRAEDVPPEYRSGIGKEGVRALGEFVDRGGRLVAFDGACEVAIDACGLKMENAVKGLDSSEYLTHGSTLRAEVDTGDPLAYGMPPKPLVFSWDSAVFTIHEALRAQRYRVVARYPDEDILQSGRLVGEDKIAGKPGMVAAYAGDGEVVLIGFRPQHRAQTHGTYKLLFNCLWK